MIDFQIRRFFPLISITRLLTLESKRERYLDLLRSLSLELQFHVLFVPKYSDAMKAFTHLSFMAAIPLVACTFNSDISNDIRLSPLIGKPLITKEPLRLYGIDYQRSSNEDLYDLTKVNYGDEDLIGMIPVGSNVRFEKAMKRSGGGRAWERFEGQVSYKDESYTIAYNLGLAAYPDGWRRVYDVFEEEKQ